MKLAACRRAAGIAKKTAAPPAAVPFFKDEA